MSVCYVIDNVPEEELQNVKDAMAVDGCTPKVEEQDNGLYKVSAICGEDE